MRIAAKTVTKEAAKAARIAAEAWAEAVQAVEAAEVESAAAWAEAKTATERAEAERAAAAWVLVEKASAKIAVAHEVEWEAREKAARVSAWIAAETEKEEEVID
jgi:hypothetical protein